MRNPGSCYRPLQPHHTKHGDSSIRPFSHHPASADALLPLVSPEAQAEAAGHLELRVVWATMEVSAVTEVWVTMAQQVRHSEASANQVRHSGASANQVRHSGASANQARHSGASASLESRRRAWAEEKSWLPPPHEAWRHACRRSAAGLPQSLFSPPPRLPHWVVGARGQTLPMAQEGREASANRRHLGALVNPEGHREAWVNRMRPVVLVNPEHHQLEVWASWEALVNLARHLRKVDQAAWVNPAWPALAWVIRNSPRHLPVLATAEGWGRAAWAN